MERIGTSIETLRPPIVAGMVTSRNHADSVRGVQMRIKMPGETYPLKLTWNQWESLIHCTRIKNKIKERLQEAGEGTQIFGITRKEAGINCCD